MAKLVFLLVLLMAVSIHSETVSVTKINKYSSFYPVVRAASCSVSETFSTTASPCLTVCVA
jgi:hypothetical protein